MAYSMPEKHNFSLQRKNSRETIHSGHFMVSDFEADELDDEGMEIQYSSGNESSVEEIEGVKIFNRGGIITYAKSIDDEIDPRTVSIDATLSKLFQTMSIAYRQNITCPKWNGFKGIRLRWKDKIRLNNIIWRCWHMQYIEKAVKITACQFALDVDMYNRPENVVLEGKYWKRQMNAVTAEYRKWRIYYKNRLTGVDSPSDNTDNLLFDLDDEMDWSPSILIKQGINLEECLFADTVDLTDMLFSTNVNPQPIPFPNARELARNIGNSDLLQPGLIQLQPDIYNDDLLDIHEMLVGRGLPTVPEEDMFTEVGETAGLPPSPPSVSTPTPTANLGFSAKFTAITGDPQHPSSPAMFPPQETYIPNRKSPQPPPPPLAATTSSTLHHTNYSNMSTTSSPSALQHPSYSTMPTPRHSSTAAINQPALSTTLHQPTTLHQATMSTSHYSPTTLQHTIVSNNSTTKTLLSSSTVSEGPPPNWSNQTKQHQFIAPKTIPKKKIYVSTLQTCQTPTYLPPNNQNQFVNLDESNPGPNVTWINKVNNPPLVHQSFTQGVEPFHIYGQDSASISIPSTTSSEHPNKISISAPTRLYHDPPTPPFILGLPLSNTLPHRGAVPPYEGSTSSSSSNVSPITVPSAGACKLSPIYIPRSTGRSSSVSLSPVTPSSIKSIQQSPAGEQVYAGAHLFTFKSSPSDVDRTSPGQIANVPSPTCKPFRLKSESHRIQYKEHRRVSHINAEQKRRCHIKSNFDLLHSLVVPSISQNPHAKISKALMLQKGAEYIVQTKHERAQLVEAADKLRADLDLLNADINSAQSKLPATGAPISHTRQNKIKEKFDAYVRDRTLSNPKYYILSLIAESLLESFNASVSTGSVEDLSRSSMAWIDQHCSLNILRPIVSNAMRRLSISTNILTTPNTLNEDIFRKVTKPESSKESVQNNPAELQSPSPS